MTFDIVELPKNAYKTYFSHELFAYIEKKLYLCSRKG